MSEQWVYGLHAVKAVLKNPLRTIHHVYLAESRKDKRLHEIQSLAGSRGLSCTPLQAIVKKFEDKNHQGAIAKVQALPEYQEADLPFLLDNCKASPLILILDSITDVHNLGACLRTADAAGVDMLILPKDKSASVNDVVSKIACGAAESVAIVRVVNLARCMKKLQDLGVWLYGAAGEADQDLYQLDAKSAIALVMGAEDNGLRRLTRESCDALFSIPMLGAVDSLNVSVATGVALYEVVRQRL